MPRLRRAAEAFMAAAFLAPGVCGPPGDPFVVILLRVPFAGFGRVKFVMRRSLDARPMPAQDFYRHAEWRSGQVSAGDAASSVYERGALPLLSPLLNKNVR